jgi:hypothetical protein
VRLVSTEDLTLLGSAVTRDAIKGALLQRQDVLKVMCDRLETLDPHTALFLLANALGIPKFMYTLRTCPTWIELDVLRSN